ncbi:MAG: nucleotide exchange factor GrpE [Sphingomonadales bacterium]
MSEQDQKKVENAEVPPAVTEVGAEAPGPAADQREGQEAGVEAVAPSGPEEAVINAQGEIAGLKERLLRSMAETENLRARAEREREDTAKYAVTGFARDVLTVADNLRRALDSVTDDLRENDAVKTVVDGVEMTERQLLQTLEKHGIRVINPMGEKFDHNFHQAMFEADAGDQPPGTVIQVMQTGFAIHDRLLRPAMVGIAKRSGNAKSKPGEGVDTVV